MKYKINYVDLPVMAIGFTQSTALFGRLIQWVRKSIYNHAFIVTQDHGQKFATEETGGGLKENSLEKYTTDKNKIVAMYFFKGFEKKKTSEDAQCYLAEIRRRAGEESKYDFWGLLRFIPVIGKWVKPDPKKQWCSENGASILKKYGATFINKVEIAPDELLKAMKESPDCVEVKGFYYKNIDSIWPYLPS